MSRRLTEDDIKKAVRLLDGWAGKLTWERFLALLSTELGGVKYTKPGLRKQPSILSAWEMAKARSNGGAPAAGGSGNEDPALAHARQTIQRLRNEVERLTQENRDLLERFQRWAYNASVERGMTLEQLDREIIVKPTTRDGNSKPRPVN